MTFNLFFVVLVCIANTVFHALHSRTFFSCTNLCLFLLRKKKKIEVNSLYLFSVHLTKASGWFDSNINVTAKTKRMRSLFQITLGMITIFWKLDNIFSRIAQNSDLICVATIMFWILQSRAFFSYTNHFFHFNGQNRQLMDTGKLRIFPYLWIIDLKKINEGCSRNITVAAK